MKRGSIEAEVGGDHARQLDLEHLEPGIDLARHARPPSLDLDFAREGRLRATPEGGQHLTGLVAIIVDRLLAEEHDSRLLAAHQLEEDARGGERFERAVGNHMDRAIGTHREPVA